MQEKLKMTKRNILVKYFFKRCLHLYTFTKYISSCLKSLFYCEVCRMKEK